MQVLRACYCCGAFANGANLDSKLMTSNERGGGGERGREGGRRKGGVRREGGRERERERARERLRTAGR